MTGQLESVMPDAEVQNVCEQIAGTMEGAYDLLLKRRDSQYAAAIAPLDAEIAALQQEHAELTESAHKLELLAPARAREAQREADRLLLDGKAAKAEAKLQEVREAEAAPGAMKARQAEISARLEVIAEERKTIARRVFADWFPEVQHVIRAAERGLFVVLLDKLRASFYEFQERSGTGGTVEHPYSFLIKDSYLTGLTADERSAEWRSGQKWYCPQR